VNDPVDSEKGYEAFRWRVRLSDKAPGKLWVIWAVAVGAGLVGTLVYENPLLGLLGFAIILAATAEFWFGVNYTVDENGASSRIGPSLSRIEWENVRRVVTSEEGVKLSPLVNAESRLDAFRGVFLRFGGENRERVLDAVRRHVKEGCSISGKTS
jgi:hypothetical protein